MIFFNGGSGGTFGIALLGSSMVITISLSFYDYYILFAIEQLILADSFIEILDGSSLTYKFAIYL